MLPRLPKDLSEMYIQTVSRSSDGLFEFEQTASKVHLKPDYLHRWSQSGCLVRPRVWLICTELMRRVCSSISSVPVSLRLFFIVHYLSEWMRVFLYLLYLYSIKFCAVILSKTDFFDPLPLRLVVNGQYVKQGTETGEVDVVLPTWGEQLVKTSKCWWKVRLRATEQGIRFWCRSSFFFLKNLQARS